MALDTKTITLKLEKMETMLSLASIIKLTAYLSLFEKSIVEPCLLKYLIDDFNMKKLLSKLKLELL